MSQKIKAMGQSDNSFQVLGVYIEPMSHTNTFNWLTSTEFTRNDEGFSDMLDRHMRKYSKAWKQLSRL